MSHWKEFPFGYDIFPLSCIQRPPPVIYDSSCIGYCLIYQLIYYSICLKTETVNWMSFEYNILSLAIFIIFYFFILFRWFELDLLSLSSFIVRHTSLVVSFRSDIFGFEHMDQLIMKIKDQTDGTTNHFTRFI